MGLDQRLLVELRHQAGEQRLPITSPNDPYRDHSFEKLFSIDVTL